MRLIRSIMRELDNAMDWRGPSDASIFFDVLGWIFAVVALATILVGSVKFFLWVWS